MHLTEMLHFIRKVQLYVHPIFAVSGILHGDQDQRQATQSSMAKYSYVPRRERWRLENQIYTKKVCTKNFNKGVSTHKFR